MSAVFAAPLYDVGDDVSYVDHHNRTQTGAVQSIEAHWQFYGRGRAPLILYTIAHPTYTNRRAYVEPSKVFGLSNAETAQ